MDTLIICANPHDCQQVLLLILLAHEIQCIPLVLNIGKVVNGHLAFHYIKCLENVFGTSARAQEGRIVEIHREKCSSRRGRECKVHYRV